MGDLTFLDKVFNVIGVIWDFVIGLAFGFLLALFFFLLTGEVVEWLYFMWFPGSTIVVVKMMAIKWGIGVAAVVWLAYELNNYNNNRIANGDSDLD